MKHQWKRIFGIMSATLVLSGCTYFEHQRVSQFSAQHQLCSRLRNELIYHENNPNFGIGQSTPIQQARVLNTYERYNCDLVPTRIIRPTPMSAYSSPP